MHLLATTSGLVDGSPEAIDLNQSPADIVVLSAADSELSSLARAHDASPCPLRLANLLQLQHNLSVDLYIEKTLAHAKLIVLRLLGGASYWPYGLDQIEAIAREKDIALAVLPGDAQPDPDLTARSTLEPHHVERLRQYLITGGQQNAAGFLAYCRHLLGECEAPAPAGPLAKAGLYRDTSVHGRPLAALTFYSSVLEGAQTAPVDALMEALATRGIGCKALHVASLKDRASTDLIAQQLAETPPDVILNATSFAVASGGTADPLARYDCPVLQVVFSGSSEESWQASAQGLNARDLAMNVVLPELDGRIMTRAVSFKADSLWHEGTQCRIVTYRPVPDRIDFVADLAANWVKLRRTPAPARKVAIILANYPNKDGRIANGVGYDTPASTVAILDAMKAEGYAVSDYPSTGNGIIEDLQRGPTNAPVSPPSPCPGSTRAPFEKDHRVKLGEGERENGVSLNLADYLAHFSALPDTVRTQVTARWGAPETDPFFRENAFHLPIRRYGSVAVAIQPARGYNIDPKSTYHDPALVPPHGYLAFYVYLRHHFGAHAVIHNGKHGNLEWLPGKATGLSAACFPESTLGPVPQLYPFIVNDPGEGTQAKRRTSAVIIDHLTPPLTRAETYGPLKDLEALVDEYYLASGLDRRRKDALKSDILALTQSTRLDADAGFTGDTESDLQRLDAYLCDLKEAQIRDGLHILGTSPQGRLETDLLVALTRVPRGLGEGGDASLIRALSNDFGFGGFDPLTCNFGETWTGPKPDALAALIDDPWRTNGDTVERLELYATALLADSPSLFLSGVIPAKAGIPLPFAETKRDADLRQHDAVNNNADSPSLFLSGVIPAKAGIPLPFADTKRHADLRQHDATNNAHAPGRPKLGPRLRGDDASQVADVLARIDSHIRPALRACGPSEIAAILAGLAGRFVAPGPSGAPTRGRLDVLPTGRNFYSLDNRTVPTPTAWTLGQTSAEDLLTRHFQDTGSYPKALGLTAWGTSNMRTGGDDIAQALALIGVKPVWEPSSWRVTGYEIIPLAKLGRPRVDVTLRISGFFRDAFPAQIELLDKAIRAVAALDEDEDDNPLAHRVRHEAKTLTSAGVAEAEARDMAGFRIFGSKPGAYGAGLQALIDEKIWTERADLAAAYVTWGAYAYGAKAHGLNDEKIFTERLKRIEAVVHNQDNREHDLLDSDDYYQFEGGMTAAVEQASGARPRVYHNDHSRPERPVIRTLEEEVGRVMRSRVVNPKWIDGVKRHGYKGAFEIAATIDYMFAFAATTGAVKSHHFDLAFDAFLGNEATRGFIADNNPAALADIAERFREAASRGLWQPRLNSAHALLEEIIR